MQEGSGSKIHLLTRAKGPEEPTVTPAAVNGAQLARSRANRTREMPVGALGVFRKVVAAMPKPHNGSSAGAQKEVCGSTDYTCTVAREEPRIQANPKPPFVDIRKHVAMMRFWLRGAMVARSVSS